MTSASSGPLIARRGWRDAWAWMRWDVPTRIVLLIAAPLIWIAVADIDPWAIGCDSTSTCVIGCSLP